MSNQESTVYPTDILRSKYRTFIEAAILCGCTVQDIVDAVEGEYIPYAEFAPPGQKRRVPQVNIEDVKRYLESVK